MVVLGVLLPALHAGGVGHTRLSKPENLVFRSLARLSTASMAERKKAAMARRTCCVIFAAQKALDLLPRMACAARREQGAAQRPHCNLGSLGYGTLRPEQLRCRAV